MPDYWDPDAPPPPEKPKPARYVCAFCGTPVEPDRSVTQLDPRFAIGKCPKCEVKGLRQLVREDVAITQREKRKR